MRVIIRKKRYFNSSAGRLGQKRSVDKEALEKKNG